MDGITRQDRMIYYGEKPWHSKGTPKDRLQTVEEALQAINGDYVVSLQPMFLADGTEVDTHKATVREDTGALLGVVGANYAVHQNREVFEAINSILGTDEARVETAGTLFGGKKAWALVQIGGIMRTKQTDDTYEKYLLAATSHDGSLPSIFKLVVNRVVCNNTLNFALSEAGNYFYYHKHTRSSELVIADAIAALGFINHRFEVVQSIIDQLADHQPTDEEVRSVFMKLIPNPTNEEEDKLVNTTQAQRGRDKLMELFENGTGNTMDGIRGTSSAVLNSVTEYADHYRTIRCGEGVDPREQRLASNWFGTSDQFKKDGFKLITKMAGISRN